MFVGERGEGRGVVSGLRLCGLYVKGLYCTGVCNDANGVSSGE